MKDFLFLYILLFSSCASHNNITNDIHIFESRPVILPSNMEMTLNGEKYEPQNVDENGMRFIIYVDSISCSSCVINQMDLWNNYINYAKNALNGKLKFYFIMSPSKSDIGSVKVSLKVYSINSPVFIDIRNDFEKLNPHLPKNKAMHTFLLDENNKVILVGNPLHNKEIEKLFYKKTQELLSK